MKKCVLVCIWVLLVLILLATPCYSLGVAPATQEFMFEPNMKKTLKLKIINSNGDECTAFIYSDGELGKYINIHESIITFSKGETEKIVFFDLNLPDKLDDPGQHQGFIVIRETVSKVRKGETAVSAVMTAVAKVIVDVPYPGEYAKIRLFVPNFKADKESNFLIEVTNLGSETIFTSTTVDILGIFNERLITLKPDEEKIIKPKEKDIISVPWKPNLLGEYYARAIVVYNDNSAEDEKMFTVGEPTINIESISTGKFTLGGVAKFDIYLKSEWNKPITNVHSEITIKDKDGNKYLRTKTPSIDISPTRKQKLEAYWDTEKVTEGDYEMEIVMKYLGKKVDRTFDILVEQNAITIKSIGLVSGEIVKEHEISSNEIMIIIVIVLIALNALIYMKFKRKNQ